MLTEESLPAASSNPTRPKRLILVAMDKGGVANRSLRFCSRNGCTRGSRNFSPSTPITTTPHSLRFVPDAQFPRHPAFENLDRIIEVMQEHPLVLVDGVGSQQRIFLDWLEETNLLKLRHAMSWSSSVVLSSKRTRIPCIRPGEAVSRIGNQVDWLVVRNHKSMRTTRIYDQSKARKELLGCGAKEMTLPKLTITSCSFSSRIPHAGSGAGEPPAVFD